MVNGTRYQNDKQNKTSEWQTEQDIRMVNGKKISE